MYVNIRFRCKLFEMKEFSESAHAWLPTFSNSYETSNCAFYEQSQVLFIILEAFEQVQL